MIKALMSRSKLKLSDGSISLRDKAIFTGMIIALIVLIAFFLNQHYYGSLRNTISSDFLIYAATETEIDQSLYEDCIQFQRQLGNMINESIDE
jgi:hypothetical protein